MTAQQDLRELMRSLVWPIYVPALLVSICLHGITILLPLYVLDLGGSAGMAALVIGLRGVGSMLSGMPAGISVARFGDTRVIIAGLLLVAAAVAGFAITDTIWMLAPLGFLFGVGTGVWQIGRLNYMTEKTTTADRGRAISVMAGLQRGGFLIGPALGGIIAQILGFQAFFWLCAAIYLSTLILVLRCARPGARSPRTGSAARNLLDTAVKTRGIMLRAGPPLICLQVLRASRTLILPLWGAYIGLTPSQIGIAFSIAAVVDMLMFLPAGWMIDHWGRRVVLVPAMLLMAGSSLLLGVSSGLIGFGALCLMSGLGNGFSTGIGMTLSGDFAPPELRGEFFGLWKFVGDVGTAGGPFVISAVVGAFGLVPAGIVVAGIGLAGLGCVWLFLPETRAKTT